MKLAKTACPVTSVAKPLSTLLTCLGLLPILIMLSGCLMFGSPVSQVSVAPPGSVITTTVNVMVSETIYDPSVRGYFGISLPEGAVLGSAEIPFASPSVSGTLTYSPTLSGLAEKMNHRPGYTWWVGASQDYPSSTSFGTMSAVLSFTLGSETGSYTVKYSLASNGSAYQHLYPRIVALPLSVTTSYGAAWQPHDAMLYGRPGETREVQVRVENPGVAPDQFTFSTSGWLQVLDAGELLTLTAEIQPGEGITLTVRANIPADAEAGRYPMQVQAVSTVSPSQASTLWIEVNVVPEDFILSSRSQFLGQLMNPLTLQDYDIQLPIGIESVAADVSPDRRWLALRSDFSSSVQFMDLNNLPTIYTLSIQENVGTRIAFTPDSQYAVVTHPNSNHVRLVNMATLSYTEILTITGGPTDIVMLPETTQALIVTYQGKVFLYDWQANSASQVLALPEEIRGVAAPADASALYMIGENTSSIYGLDTASMIQLPTIQMPVVISSIGVSPDGLYLYAASIPAKKFYMLDAVTGAVLWTLDLFWPGNITPLEAGLEGLVYMTYNVGSAPSSGTLYALLDVRRRSIVRTGPYLYGGMLPILDTGLSVYHYWVNLPVVLK